MAVTERQCLGTKWRVLSECVASAGMLACGEEKGVTVSDKYTASTDYVDFCNRDQSAVAAQLTMHNPVGVVNDKSALSALHRAVDMNNQPTCMFYGTIIKQALTFAQSCDIIVGCRFDIMSTWKSPAGTDASAGYFGDEARCPDGGA